MRTRLIAAVAACLLAVACGGEAEPADPATPPGTLQSPADLDAAVAVTRAAGSAAIAIEIDQSRPFSALDATGVWDFGADAGTFVVARDPSREDEVDQQVAVAGDRRWQRPAAGGPWEEAPAERWGAVGDVAIGPWPATDVAAGPDALHILETAEAVEFLRDSANGAHYDVTLPVTSPDDCRIDNGLPCVVPEPVRVVVDDQGRVTKIRLRAERRVEVSEGLGEDVERFLVADLWFTDFGIDVDLGDLPGR